MAKELGGDVIPVVCDHSDDKAIEDLFKKIDADNNGRIDFLVNNCYAAVLTLLGEENTINALACHVLKPIMGINFESAACSE